MGSIFRLVTLTAVCAGSLNAVAAERDLTRTDRFPGVPGTRVVVDAASLDVVARSGDVREVEVTTELSISGVGSDRAAAWIARHTPTATAENGTVRVVASPGRSGFLGLGIFTARARLGIVAPAATIPDLTTTSGSIALRGDFPNADPLRLRTATGGMEMVGAAGSVDVRTASGDSRVQVVRPLNRFFARSSSGNVVLDGGARDVEVDTASGDVYLSGLSGSARVITAAGKITLRWDRLEPDASVRVRSTSSRIHLVLPDTVRPSGTLTTTGGNIRSDFPGLVNEAGDTVELAGDGPRLEVETASGEIIVSQAIGWNDASEGPPPQPDAPGPTHDAESR